MDEIGCDSGRAVNASIEFINQRESRLCSHAAWHTLDGPSPASIGCITPNKSKSIVVQSIGLVVGQHVSSLLFALCFLVASPVAGLSGKHVCQHEERYTINVTEYFPRNVTVRSFQWCMQVPPRCSIFTQRIINESRINEEVKSRLVDVCCDGYELDSNGAKCEPSCNTKCANGRCNEENKCYCEPGYRGDYCEKDCDPSRWGRYCRYHCDCQRGSCDSASGLCTCPPGWTGLKCEKRCQVGYFGVECLGVCGCSMNQICDPQDGRCTNKVKVAVLKKYHTFDTVPAMREYTTQMAKKVDMYLLTTEPSNANRQKHNHPTATAFTNESELEITSATQGTPNTLITSTTPQSAAAATTMNGKLTNEGVINNADKFSTSNQDLNEKSTNAAGAANKVDTIGKRPAAMAIENADVTDSHAEVNIKSMDRRVMKSEIPLKGKVHAEVAVNDSWNNHDDADTTATASLETKHQEVDDDEVPDTTTTTTTTKEIYNFATISFICIVFVAVSGFLIAGHLLKRHEKEMSSHVNKNIPKSIFHTPLPEPPQSPFFESPACAHYHKRIGDNEVAFHPRTARTSYTCEENKAASELSDVFYDQLPSTGGSYKAALVLEPPLLSPTHIPSLDEYVQEANQSNASTSENAHCSFNSPTASENVYDEIPCWTRSAQNDALYINTRIENKTQF